jgi:hypothetical protein
MKTASTLTIGAALAAVTLISAAPASAQSRYYDRRDRDDNTAENALIGAAVGGLAGALLGNGDGTSIAGGALAGAAIGAVASGDNRSGCDYYRGGRCYRNQGHWEREHGINSRDGRYNYRYDRRDRSDYRRNDRWDRRDYRNDRRW